MTNMGPVLISTGTIPLHELFMSIIVSRMLIMMTSSTRAYWANQYCIIIGNIIITPDQCVLIELLLDGFMWVHTSMCQWRWLPASRVQTWVTNLALINTSGQKGYAELIPTFRPSLLNPWDWLFNNNWDSPLKSELPCEDSRSLNLALNYEHQTLPSNKAVRVSEASMWGKQTVLIACKLWFLLNAQTLYQQLLCQPDRRWFFFSINSWLSNERQQKLHTQL